ncbi:MAG: hypothetical protein KU37_05570 [Sulfuricurvum sp. PC08-66]|nr:MAG: hypothetical protein KU37_05570 [Sulfuricurvum sp. PC08-66]
MGELRYVTQLLEIYELPKREVTHEQVKVITKIIKRLLTKKEFKAFFVYQEFALEEIAQKMQTTIEAVALYHKKARHKLIDSKVKNEILAAADTPVLQDDA